MALWIATSVDAAIRETHHIMLPTSPVLGCGVRLSLHVSCIA